MGSNISRHTGKGLSGRRAQSSGSLYKMIAPRVGRVFNPCGEAVKHRDRNKFCGSLPNNLDDKQVCSASSSSESLYRVNSNCIEIYEFAKTESGALNIVEHQDLGGGDQGYGSEWSPDEEHISSTNSTFCEHLIIRKSSEVNFITKENTFEVKLQKGSRGLGLSVSGGVDSLDNHPGLIRIKRIFPHQPAWESGILKSGDIILEVNGAPLTGLTNYEALEVLRMTPSDVMLKICRPPSDAFCKVEEAAGEPPPLPKRDPSCNVFFSSQTNNLTKKLPLSVSEICGEFDVTLNKVNGSLGFTLRKEDESVLGHYIRALVREPAISDGRIQPGDKIVLVNGRNISSMSHEEAIIFLRQCGSEVNLRLFRDPAQTPISALSPAESYKTFRPKPVLRKEAVDMLCNLAVRKLNPGVSNDSESRSLFKRSSPSSSPRIRKLAKTPNEYKLINSDPNGTVNSVEVGDNKDVKLISNGCEDFNLKENCEPTSLPSLSVSAFEFRHENPVYQSAHPIVHLDNESQREKFSDKNVPSSVFEQRVGSQSLLKWKGIVFSPEERESTNEKKNNFKHDQIVTVELYRGWNSRLGFSLRGLNSRTLISAIYPDSVAAKDGRLQPGDEIIMINDDPVKEMTTGDVIDLLRKVRGAIAITVVRGVDKEL